jgi:hypothetical protein
VRAGFGSAQKGAGSASLRSNNRKIARRRGGACVRAGTLSYAAAMFGAPCFAPRFARALAFGAVFAGLMVPEIARADEPVAPEADTNPDVLPSSAARTNLLLVGGAVTVGWYAVAVGSSYAWKDADSASSLRIPFAGPFMGLAHTGCGEHESSCETSTVVLRSAVYVLSAVGQLGGVAAMLEGAFIRTASPGTERSPVRLRRASVEQSTALHFSVEPTPPAPASRDSGLNGLSVSVFGRF